MEALLASVGLVALAEMGDKTQLLSLALAARYRRPLPIVGGIALATLLNHALAGALGAWLTRVLGPQTLQILLALSFLAMAAWMLVPDKLELEERPAPRYGVLAATTVAFFFVEMGDKTQVATVALAAKYAAVATVVAGTTLGMLLANVPVVVFGERLLRRVPVRRVQRIAAALFLGLALLAAGPILAAGRAEGATDMLARDVMTAPVVSVRPDTKVHDIAALLLDCRISAVPVVDEGGHVRGIVSEGDLINRADAGTRHRRAWWLEMLNGPEERSRDYLRAHGQRAEDVMTREVVTASEDTPLPQLAALLEKHHVKRVPVVRQGRLVGIVSRANLLQGFALSAPTWPMVKDDRQIRDALNKALKEAGLPMHQVNVTVSNGTAQLWGWIDAEVQRRAAHAAAETTPGVRAVEDHLVVTTAAVRAGRGYV